MKSITTRRMVVLTAALCLLLAGGAFDEARAGEKSRTGAPDMAASVPLKGVDNFFRVTPDLYRAAQPDRDGMRALEAYGIKTVINLRRHHSDVDEVEGMSLTLVELPKNAWNVHDDAFVIKVLQAIRDAEKPVLIHCQHGADRTGLMVAMYRIIEQGWTREEALYELRNGGYGFHTIWRNIPEYILEEADLEAIRAGLK